MGDKKNPINCKLRCMDFVQIFIFCLALHNVFIIVICDTKINSLILIIVYMMINVK